MSHNTKTAEASHWTALHTVYAAVLATLTLITLMGIARGATDDSVLKLNSADGSTEFAVQNNNGAGVDVVMMNSLGGVTISSNAIHPGTTIYANGIIQNSGLFISNSATPNIALGNGCGTGSTVSIGAGGTNSYGIVTCAAANVLSANSPIATITPSISAPNKIICTISAANGTAAALVASSAPYVTGTNTTWVINAGTATLTNGQHYSWNYHCGGY